MPHTTKYQRNTLLERGDSVWKGLTVLVPMPQDCGSGLWKRIEKISLAERCNLVLGKHSVFLKSYSAPSFFFFYSFLMFKVFLNHPWWFYPTVYILYFVFH